VQESGENKRSEDLQRRAEQAKLKAFEEESRRLDSEAQQRSEALAQNLKQKEQQYHQKALKNAQEERNRKEDTLRKHLEELKKKFEEERQRKIEARRREEEELRRKAEEEQRIREEQERKKAEEEARLRAEAELRAREEELRLQEEERLRREEEERRRREEEQARQEGERLRKEEEERHRLEEELRRQEEERLRKEEEEKRRQEEQQKRRELEQARREEERKREEDERQERIRTLVASAEEYFNSGDYERARVEIAKALVNDPANPGALELEAKISEAQGKPVAPPSVQEKPKAKKRGPSKMTSREGTQKKRGKLPLILILSVFVIIVGIIVAYQLKKNVFTTPANIAVLPWMSSSALPEEKILGSSLAEEVVTRLERLKPAVVMGYSSAYSLSAHTADPSQGIFQLGYLYTLSGTITQSGDNISVEARLADASGHVGWSERYEKPVSEMWEIPGEITTAMIRFLNIKPVDLPAALNSAGGSIHPTAYVFYLRGKEMLHRHTPESLQNAYQLFQEAIQDDPNFAEGLAAAAEVTVSRIEEGWIGPDTSIDRAAQMAQAAIYRNAFSESGYLALGKVLAQRKAYREALLNFDSAMRIAPNKSQIYLEKGKVNLKIGRYKESKEAFNQAYKLNPRDPQILKTFAMGLQLMRVPREGMWYHETALFFADDSTDYLIGPLADAITLDADLSLTHGGRVSSACESRFSSNPLDYFSMYQLARLKQRMGKFEESGKLLKRIENLLQNEIRKQPKDSRAMAYLALTLTRLGQFTEASILGQKALSLAPGNPEVLYKVAQMYSIQMFSQKKGIDAVKKEEAVKTLRMAIALSYRINELTNPDFFNMYDLPEFKALIKEPF